MKSKCHVNISLGLVGGCIPCIPPCAHILQRNCAHACISNCWARPRGLQKTVYFNCGSKCRKV